MRRFWGWFRLWCAVVYVLLLFGFALIYFCLPGKHFYHANVAREPVVFEYEKRISSELQKAIIDTFQSYFGDNWQWTGNWGVDSSTFTVRELKASAKDEGVEVSFKLSVTILDRSKPKRQLFADPIVTFSATGGADIAIGELGDSGQQPRNKKINVLMPDAPPDKGLWDKKLNNRFPAIFFPTQSADEPLDEVDSQPANGAQSSSEATMPIPRQLDIEILNLAKGIQGDPSHLDGHFGRMFYLSAVTITTLGYGDIAPLTSYARTLISTEAVLGIIVIGLFIGGAPRDKSSNQASNIS